MSHTGHSPTHIAEEIVDSLPIPCALFDGAGQLLHANEAGHALLPPNVRGHDLNEVLGRLQAGSAKHSSVQVRQLSDGLQLFTAVGIES